jgi:hypothetical protein
MDKYYSELIIENLPSLYFPDLMHLEIWNNNHMLQISEDIKEILIKNFIKSIDPKVFPHLKRLGLPYYSDFAQDFIQLIDDGKMNQIGYLKIYFSPIKNPDLEKLKKFFSKLKLLQLGFLELHFFDLSSSFLEILNQAIQNQHFKGKVIIYDIELTSNTRKFLLESDPQILSHYIIIPSDQ